jgi:hypothetical protein
MSSKDVKWYCVPVPNTVRLSEIQKEQSSHGLVYLLFECEQRSSLFIGQSIPALTKAINSKAIQVPEKRLHCSSLYRVLRSESKKASHKNYRCLKFKRTAIPDINTYIQKFPSIVFVSKSPDLWKTSELDVDQVESILTDEGLNCGLDTLETVELGDSDVDVGCSN